MLKTNAADVILSTIKKVHDHFVEEAPCIGPIFEPECEPDTEEEK